MWFLRIPEQTAIVFLYSIDSVVVEKDEKDQLDRCREKWRSDAKSKVK